MNILNKEISYPYDPKSILDEEVEDESDHTDEGEDSNTCAFPCLRLVQLLLCNIPDSQLKVSCCPLFLWC